MANKKKDDDDILTKLAGQAERAPADKRYIVLDLDEENFHTSESDAIETARDEAKDCQSAHGVYELIALVEPIIDPQIKVKRFARGT